MSLKKEKKTFSHVKKKIIKKENKIVGWEKVQTKNEELQKKREMESRKKVEAKIQTFEEKQIAVLEEIEDEKAIIEEENLSLGMINFNLHIVI